MSAVGNPFAIFFTFTTRPAKDRQAGRLAHLGSKEAALAKPTRVEGMDLRAGQSHGSSCNHLQNG